MSRWSKDGYLHGVDSCGRRQRAFVASEWSPRDLPRSKRDTNSLRSEFWNRRQPSIDPRRGLRARDCAFECSRLRDLEAPGQCRCVESRELSWPIAIDSVAGTSDCVAPPLSRFVKPLRRPRSASAAWPQLSGRSRRRHATAGRVRTKVAVERRTKAGAQERTSAPAGKSARTWSPASG